MPRSGACPSPPVQDDRPLPVEMQLPTMPVEADIHPGGDRVGQAHGALPAVSEVGHAETPSEPGRARDLRVHRPGLSVRFSRERPEAGDGPRSDLRCQQNALCSFPGADECSPTEFTSEMLVDNNPNFATEKFPRAEVERLLDVHKTYTVHQVDKVIGIAPVTTLPIVKRRIILTRCGEDAFWNIVDIAKSATETYDFQQEVDHLVCYELDSELVEYHNDEESNKTSLPRATRMELLGALVRCWPIIRPTGLFGKLRNLMMASLAW